MNSGIEVFFTEVNRPWSNASAGTFYRVNVYTPDGPQYIGNPAPNGYASIDVPPGRYVVTGTLGGFYVNFDTNETIVNVACGQRVCVTLIPRTLHQCIYWLRLAFEQIAARPELARTVADRAGEMQAALAELEEAIPEERRMPGFLHEAESALREAVGEFEGGKA
ncbi:MAG TPA: hypothetical protein VF520_04270 [Thermoleophilaceae bacterium]|jgi:hypothetical protein